MALIFVTSCTKTETMGSKEITANFTVSFGNSTTRASFDGDGAAANVNRCKMQIWWEGKKYGEAVVATKVVTGKVTADFTNIVLLKDQNYTFLFWADKVNDAATPAGLAQDLYYNTSDLKAVTIDNTTYSGNNDSRDAFSKCEKKTVSESFTETVILKRPFAQLNVITTDTKAFHDQVGDDLFAYMFPSLFDIAFTAPTKFNVETGEATEPKAYSVTDLAVYAQLVEAQGKQTLTMDYILAPESESTLTDISWTAKNPVSPISYSFTNIPLQRNFRTNITGELLTKKGNWTVEVNPEWNTPEFDVEK